MIENPRRYPIILFDWGNTVMRDDPSSTMPMVEWQTVEPIDGIGSVLDYLQSSGRQVMLATSAAFSDETQIRGALARVGIDRYFSRIFCFKNTHLPKGEAFYREILDGLNIPPTEALMVGDSFERDVQDANAVGIFAVWFNPESDESRQANSHTTIHSMQELRHFFESLDGK
ncbi:MAG TPA: HAD family hydrolase [Anaerolineales bacterium]|nr:HAD family hydrolase [Anaerolineales bacterium]